ncbi:DNA-protecting protein DprA [Yersinia kristensenii]|uniref:DNA-processing protein DprA n=1 Tax=Yersinia kristensenii TaxID=28152 RepID=UPI001C6090FA|nr:DNA-processing protein DprA [Yersinia kristensenii]MBW5817089.1 DNA-protecting protein DprA [Yersinia kristensenii]MBW5842661.1 DNA-protecting protein DprA [Yersinia kristensenii]
MRSESVLSSQMKSLLGLIIQVNKFSSDQFLLKMFQEINFDSFRDIQDLIDFINSTVLLKVKLTDEHFSFAYKELEIHNNVGVTLVPYGTNLYPNCLMNTNNPPAILYTKGNVNILNEMPGVAIVGARDVSPAGEEIARRITTEICNAGYVIISGLAIGVDAAAHKAALHAKGKTIAVLAHGLENAKPKQNARLGAEILERNGAWVSEYPIGRPALKQSFVQRNRIQVGLSAASILVEASLKSGTMTQAEFALKASRPVFAVVPHKPNNPLNLNSEGTTYLVKEGLALPLRTKSDYENLITVINKSANNIRSIYPSDNHGSVLPF